jgi:hypothetical protein
MTNAINDALADSAESMTVRNSSWIIDLLARSLKSMILPAAGRYEVKQNL